MVSGLRNYACFCYISVSQLVFLFFRWDGFLEPSSPSTLWRVRQPMWCYFHALWSSFQGWQICSWGHNLFFGTTYSQQNRKVNRHLPEVSAKCWRYDRCKMGVGCAAINTNVRLGKTGSFMWDSYFWLCLGDLLASAVTIMVMAVSSESSMTSKLNTSHTNLFSGSFKEIVSSIVTLFTAEQDWVIHADSPSGMLV